MPSLWSLKPEGDALRRSQWKSSLLSQTNATKRAYATTTQPYVAVTGSRGSESYTLFVVLSLREHAQYRQLAVTSLQPRLYGSGNVAKRLPKSRPTDMPQERKGLKLKPGTAHWIVDSWIRLLISNGIIEIDPCGQIGDQETPRFLQTLTKRHH